MSIGLRNIVYSLDWLVLCLFGWVCLVIYCKSFRLNSYMTELYICYNSEKARVIKVAEGTLLSITRLISTVVLMNRFAEYIFKDDTIGGIWLWLPQSFYAVYYSTTNNISASDLKYVAFSIAYFIISFLVVVCLNWLDIYLTIQQRAYRKLRGDLC